MAKDKKEYFKHTPVLLKVTCPTCHAPSFAYLKELGNGLIGCSNCDGNAAEIAYGLTAIRELARIKASFKHEADQPAAAALTEAVEAEEVQC